MKSRVRVLMVGMALVGAMGAQAEEGGTFEERRAKLLKHLDERIAALGSAKSCVQSANDEAGLRACHDKMREERQERLEEWRERRRERREKRQEKAK